MSASSTEGAWVTERELIIRGIGGAAQRQGRDSGKLRFTPLGADSFAYREQDVQAWLEAENGSTKGRTFVKSPAAPAPTASPATGTAPARPAPAGGGTARALWNAAVAEKVSRGMNRAAAVAAVARERPALREQLVLEANSARR